LDISWQACGVERDGSAVQPSADRAALGSVIAEHVRAALHHLPTEQRQALGLAYYGGYTQSEVAERLGATPVHLEEQDVRGLAREATEGRGVDVCIDAVGHQPVQLGIDRGGRDFDERMVLAVFRSRELQAGLERFPPRRTTLPERPRRALAFVKHTQHVEQIARACAALPTPRARVSGRASRGPHARARSWALPPKMRRTTVASRTSYTRRGARRRRAARTRSTDR